MCFTPCSRFSVVMDACSSPDNKVHGANMGPLWGRQDPGGPHVGPMNFAILELIRSFTQYTCSHSCILQCWVRYYFTNSLGLHLFVTTLEQLVLCCIWCDGIHTGEATPGAMTLQCIQKGHLAINYILVNTHDELPPCGNIYVQQLTKSWEELW